MTVKLTIQSHAVPAFVEDLTAQYKTVLLLRHGPKAYAYNDDWTHQCVVGSNDGDSCDILGLAPNPDEPETSVTNVMVREALTLLRRNGYRVINWLRKKPAGDRPFSVP